MNNCEKLPVAEFDAIVSPKIEINDTELSRDQKYLLDNYRAVSDGSCSSSLAARNPGKMVHSRWLTTANTFLRLYVSTNEPSSILIEIVQFIMTVYVPVWFNIKKNSSFIEGEKHFFEMMRLTQTMPERTRAIANKVIQRNCFFAHQENILVSMINDNDRCIRKLGWRRIFKARSQELSIKKVRNFVMPELHYNSLRYYEMINWQTIEQTKPPVTRTIAERQIKEFIENGDKPDGLIPQFPCHPQAVERLVRTVTEASARVSGIEMRDGLVRSRLCSRTKIPRFESKKDYKI